MAEKKTWIVTAGGSRPLQDIARDLENAGLKDAQVLHEVKCIIGSADDEVAMKLRGVRGVLDVSPDIQFHVADHE
jgi:hypothetical protein